MEDELHRCDMSKDVFLVGRAGIEVKAKAHALTMELVKKRKVDNETHAESWTPSNRRHEMNACWDYVCHKIDDWKELHADYNIPKIQSMSHWVERIRQFCAMKQCSAESHEEAYKMNLKDGWYTSNHNLNYLARVINFQCHILCSEIGELNLQALPQHRENSAPACRVLPSGLDMAAPLSSQS